MITEIYIEALLVNEDLADQVWEAWDKREIDDQSAILAWWWQIYSYLMATKLVVIKMGQNCDNLGMFAGYSALSKPFNTRPAIRCIARPPNGVWQCRFIID